MKSTLFDQTGVGLRPIHYQDIMHKKHDIPWFEAVSENYMFTEGKPLYYLKKIREDYPIAFHGVSLSIGSAREKKSSYLDALLKLIHQIDPWIVSDHFCWTGLGAHNAFDLLPLPFEMQVIPKIVENIDFVQNKLKQKVYFENISAYISYESSNITEVEFITDIISKSGCGLLLDINNVYVNSQNFDFDPKYYIDQIDPACVGEIHLAGHSKVADFLFDTHDRSVSQEVWDLFAYAAKKMEEVPVLIEWDESIPVLDELLEEKKKADAIIKGVRNESKRKTNQPSRLYHGKEPGNSARL